ncbi:hypothetical protein CTAYLR_001906 [Chrysophaeum taylorii]|uniref:50S ribosomal protein L10 n=1 Tax=Chrysophaeum taylorii TaxID=2483200 RepID=A0AAD7U8A2_9STRA|nr:hypothetical protein CTAYLR_001906 [Chrysophaeum taylorii]
MIAILLAAYVVAWVPRPHNVAPRQRVVVSGGRLATPLGRQSTSAGKRERVAQVATAIDDATLVFALKGEGLDIKKITALRKKLPETSTATMVKNTLMKRAGSAAGWTDETIEESQMFKQSNLWIFTGEELKETIEAYDSWIKENGLKDGGYEIRGGFMEGSHVDQQAVKAVIDLPTKPELMARLAGAIQLAGPLGIAKNIKNAKGNAQGLAVRLKKAAGQKLALAIKLSVGDEEKNPNKA